MIENIIYNFINDNDWQLNQTRTLDPFSLLRSNTLNQINTIYGDNIVLTGMEMLTFDDTLLKLVIKPGQVIKDKVLIQFKEDTVIMIDNKTESFKNEVKDNSFMIVVHYKYEKVIPANIAKIEIIEESKYDPDIHLGLYRIFFDSNGKISEVVRLIMPKDNIIYEQILQEISSVSKSAVYNCLSELGNEGIAELIGTYIRVKGTSISGYYLNDRYFLCRAVPKNNYNINTGYNENYKGSIRIIATFNASYKFYQNEYLFYLDQNTLEWKVNTQFITNDNTAFSYKDFFDIEIYEDSEYYYFYAKFNGDIHGGLEVYEIEYDTDQVIPCNIEDKEPNPYSEHKVIFASEIIRKISTSTYINNCIIWNESNDGHGSGLDADLLDGKEAAYFEKLISDLEERINAKIEELWEECRRLQNYVDKTFIPIKEKNKVKGVAVLTDDDGSYYTDYDLNLSEEERESGKKFDSIPTLRGGIVPQSELYIDRMFGEDGIIFTNTSVNPTGTRRINCEGHFHATKVYNPAFKDIAEVFEAESGNSISNCVHKIMSLDCSSGMVRPCHTTDYAIIGVCSDTYGTLLGASEEDMEQKPNLLPIALCGTVWVELENTLEPDYPNNYLGCLVGPGENGRGRIISRMDKRICVGMIVGYNPDTTKGKNLVKILVGSYFK